MRLSQWLSECRLMFGIERNTTSHAEKIISATGGLLGIMAVYWITYSAFPDWAIRLLAGSASEYRRDCPMSFPPGCHRHPVHP